MRFDPGKFSELLVATRNPGKILEVKEFFQELPLRLRFLDEFPELPVVHESAKSYEENAVLKATIYSQETGLCALADDSGLEVDALDGAPGVYSARSAGPGASDQDRTASLLARLSEIKNRRARFVCVIAIAAPSLLNVAEGSCEGIIAPAAKGTHGFGFDPIFIPEGYEQTFAELPPAVKNQISHRAKALAQAREYLKRLVA
jgi:XTP/dITP diphosphohydrolase